MFLVGLTGGIACGKSLVSKIFEEHGIPIIDADLIAKQIVEPGEEAYRNIVKAFGTEILTENGEIDRKKLGEAIFDNSEKRKLLNSMTHPLIYGTMKKKVFKYFMQGEQFVLLDLPLLYETRSVISFLHKTIVVSCDHDIQLERLMKRNSLTESEAKKRISSQMPLEEKAAMADVVIENSGSIATTRKQTEAIIILLRSSKRHIINGLIIGAIVLFAALLFFYIINLILT